MTAPDPKGSEVRPCPLCGAPADIDEMQDENGHEYLVGCSKECYVLEADEDNLHHIKNEWNNFYCWKEIDRLRAEVLKYRVALEKIKDIAQRRRSGDLEDTIYMTCIDALAPPEEK